MRRKKTIDEILLSHPVPKIYPYGCEGPNGKGIRMFATEDEYFEELDEEKLDNSSND